MQRTITRLFNSHTEAMAAITDLEQAGVPHEDISLIASNGDNWHAGHQHDRARTDDDDDNDTAEGAGKGAAEIVQRLAAAGVEIEDMAMSETSLEQIFVDLVGAGAGSQA